MSFKDVGTGTIGPNYRKSQTNQADYTGSITLDGRKILISAWLKKRNDTGQHFYSFSLSEAVGERPRPAPNHSAAAKAGQSGLDEIPEDDIPF